MAIEEQATDASAMSTIPPLEESSSTSNIVEGDDDYFGTFSAFEAPASSGFLEENAPAVVAPPPLPAMMSSSPLNEDEFFDAPFEDASMKQAHDISTENVEDETAAEMNKPEADLFSSVEDAAITPPDALAAVQSEGGPINNNHVADNNDPFSAFDGIIEGGDEQNEVSHFNQPDNVGFGEFEGTVSGSSNNDIADISPSNGDNDDSPTDTSDPVVVEVVEEESASPESGENLPVHHSTEETHATVSFVGGVSAFDHAFSEANEITEPGQEYQGVDSVTPPPVDTLSAFDAFAEIQDVPLPPFGIISTDAIEAEGDTLAFEESEPAGVATGTTTMEEDVDNYVEYAGVSSRKNAADERSNNEDKFVSHNYTTKEEDDDIEEIETTPEEVEADLLETSAVESAPTNVTSLEANEDVNDVFGDFKEKVATSDAFGAFPALARINMDTAQAEQDVLVEDDAALVTDAIGKDTAFDNAETKDNFCEFSAPNEEDLLVEKGTAFDDECRTPVENVESDDFGDSAAPEDNIEMDAGLAQEGTIQESHFDDFGRFVAPPMEEDEALVEEDLPVEEDVELAEQDTHLPEDDTALADATGKDAAFDDGAIDEEDDFVDFSAPNEEDLPVEIDAAFSEVDQGLVENAVEESDNFDDFTASNEEDLPVEVDTAFTEVDTAPLEAANEESNNFGDFTGPEDNEIDAAVAKETTQESDFDDFVGFAASPVVEDEALVEEDLPVEEDVGLAEQDTHLLEGEVKDNDDFGDFTAHVEETPLAEVNTTQDTEVEENDDFGGFAAPVEESTTPVETSANESDEFDDFGGFSSPAIESGAAAKAPEGADDEDFGNFGDFSVQETENNKEEKPVESHKPVDTQPTVEDEDDFGEFGDFAAFEEAAPADHQPTAQVEESAAEGDLPNPDVQSSQAAAEEDEFGDFGDFEESDDVVETSGEKEPSGPVHVLNENVRDMFQKVFHDDNPVESDKGDSCIQQLPFDVPMRTVLAPRKPNTEEKGDSQIYKSEKEIEDITKQIQSLPTSPPSIILSEEKWYPYSQYVFHHDGTPYTEKANLMGVASPSVPEVLSIELPTGFDASTFSPNSSLSSNARCTTPPVQSVRPTATMVDFPSADAKMTEEDAKEAAEDDEFSELSAAGKKFMEKLPDLSYMLQPNLSTVKS